MRFLSLALAGALVTSGAEAQSATADPYLGTFTSDANEVVTVRIQGSTYTGSISTNGTEYPWTGRKIGRSLIGSFQAQGQSFLFQAAVQGDQMTFLANGTTTLLHRGTAVARNRSREDTGGDGRSRRGPAPGATGQDAQIERILLSSPWCYMHYSQTLGSTNTERGVFLRDGRLVVGTGHEMASSGENGTVFGGGNGSAEYRWRVANGDLLISQQGGPFAPTGLRITQNSNGYPILNVSGKEYSQCN